MPLPYVLVIYGPCKTCIAWFVTEPLLLAIGLAVALTPHTPCAKETVGDNNDSTNVLTG